MSFLHIVVLAVVQGITEFLPVSSSGHLVLTPLLLDVDDQGLSIDVAVHVGSLAAVVLYFWRDVALLGGGGLKLLTFRRTSGGTMLLKVILATIPVIVVGYLLVRYVPDLFQRDTPHRQRFVVEIIAWTTVVFGLLLWIADRYCLSVRRAEHLTYSDAFLIGVVQTLALVPGTSRSGITMTAARFLGVNRAESARFSMLLSIPTILAAGALTVYELYGLRDVQVGIDALLAAILAFISALAAIALMMQWLRRATFTPFVVYRLLLGAGLFYYLYAI